MESPEYTHKSSIQKDGSRPKIYLADVRGFFTRLKYKSFYLIITIFFIIPLLKIGGERVLLFQVDQRYFKILGFVFNAQDIYLLFFVLTGLGFSLFFITALFGRVWCGYLCPHTVILEGVYRKIEHWIEGGAQQQKRLDNMPWVMEKISKKFLKHSIFIVVSLIFAFGFISYFVPALYFEDIFKLGLSAHPNMVLWFGILSFIFYGNFSWFREQLCLIICPYGRLQSALTDDDTIVIGYDEKRGEPRGKLNEDHRGACINCLRCVAVCPTGIDIREGLQMECIGCANCIDACDEIMVKVNQPKGLIRYDSMNGFEGNKTRYFRPRVYAYMALTLIGLMMFLFFASQRRSYEASVLRLNDKPFTVESTQIRNAFEIHIINKSLKPRNFSIDVHSEQEGLKTTLPFQSVKLEGKQGKRIPVFLSLDTLNYTNEFVVFVHVSVEGEDRDKKVPVRFLGP